MEQIPGRIFGILIQTTFLWVLTITAYFVRQEIIHAIQRVRFWKRIKIYKQYNFDLFQIPESLHGLIPYAKEFGISNDSERQKYQEAALPLQKQIFYEAVMGKENEILRWLRSVQPKRSNESNAFTFMLKSLYEMNLMGNNQRASSFWIEVELMAAQRANPKRILYYQPRPKNVIKKFFYDFFTGLIAVIIFHLYYYLVLQAWGIFSPHESSLAAFITICTLAVLLTIFTLRTASWVIKQRWIAYPLS